MKPDKHLEMVKAFRAFSVRISKEYDRAAKALERGDYEEAHRLLASLAQSHAKTAMSLRGFMIRQGFIKGE